MVKDSKCCNFMIKKQVPLESDLLAKLVKIAEFLVSTRFNMTVQYGNNPETFF